ncbi:MAG: branched-chain amino acid ABC transporter permease [Thermodesulfobacteriota bacterium]
MSITQFIQSIVSGLLLGGVFAVLAVGFSLILGIARVVNLSHPVFALIGSYITYWLLELYGWNPLLSLVAVVPALFFLGIVLERTVIRETAKRTRDITSASLVLTFGVTIIIENLLLSICKATPRLVTTSYSGKSFFLGGVALPVNFLVTFAIAAITVGVVYLFLHHTFLGKAARAVWQDRDGAVLMGINISRVTAITYGISFGTAGIGGACMSLMYSIEPSTHWAWITFVFAIVIVGGVGSIAGTAMAGLLIGLIIGISSALIPLTWINLVLFGIIIVLLLVRPTGLVRQ